MSWFTPYHVMDEGGGENLRPMSEYSRRDPGFSVPMLQSRVSNLYVQWMYGLSDGDMEPLRPYVTDTLYDHFCSQARAIREAGHTLHLERPAVLRTEILGYQALPQEDRIHVRLQTRAVIYTLDAKGNLVEGDRSAETFESRIWEFSRPAGDSTGHDTGVVSMHCPGCGAPVDVLDSAKCPFCGKLVRARHFNWKACAVYG